MQKVNELKSPPVIGKFYLVPCIEISRGRFPIIGEPHTDIELGAETVHYHHDVRFLSEKLLNDAVYIRPDYYFSREEHSMFLVTNAPEQVTFRKLKCRRIMPDFKLVPRTEYQNLHKKYLGREVKCGKCPHRNMPLESLPQDSDGNVICSGHGLKISMKENKVVERF